MRVAIDFDGTIFRKVKFPDIGEPVPLAIQTIRELRANGHELILWTCRAGSYLDMAIVKLHEYGIPFDHYNEHPKQKNLSVKVDAEIFIDDKGCGCPVVEITCQGKTETYVSWPGVRAELVRKGFIKE